MGAQKGKDGGKGTGKGASKGLQQGSPKGGKKGARASGYKFGGGKGNEKTRPWDGGKSGIAADLSYDDGQIREGAEEFAGVVRVKPLRNGRSGPAQRVIN